MASQTEQSPLVQEVLTANEHYAEYFGDKVEVTLASWPPPHRQSDLLF